MTEATWVQGDTEPPITAILQRNGDAVGTISSVKFQMRKDDDRSYTVNAAASVIDDSDPTGIAVKYLWGASDLNVPGDYHVQWEVTYASGRIETTDPPNTITVRRQ